jgi:hypothetical protein
MGWLLLTARVAQCSFLAREPLTVASGKCPKRALVAQRVTSIKSKTYEPTCTSSASPANRPFRLLRNDELAARFEQALSSDDGVEGAHCIHELWMRGEMAVHIESALERLWKHAARSIPDWLPTRHVEWLPLAYEAAAQFKSKRRGRSNVYLVLLDYSDSRADPYGVYVGMSSYLPADRFDQHKAGIRSAGCVLRRGVEVLAGPTLHLCNISRTEAARIEEQLAEALTMRGLFVQGGH